MTNPVLAWHFASAAGLRDGRPLPPDGVTLRHTGDLIMCERGLHASERLIDALNYAPGPIVCRVQCGGRIIREIDKLDCMERTIHWRFDATEVLQIFARQCALDVAHLWDMPAIVRQFLANGDETLRADARFAARNLAWDTTNAARDAAWAAAWAADWDAAWAADWDAPSATVSAAMATAWVNASASARDAAWAVAEATRGAAWTTAEDFGATTIGAAWEAAKATQNLRLTAAIEAARNNA